MAGWKHCNYAALLFFCTAIAAPMAFAAPTAAESAAAAAAEERGAMMFAYDQAAWKATDQFVAELRAAGQSIEALAAQGVQGYLVEPGDGAALLVSFYGERDGNYWAHARYRFENGVVASQGILGEQSDRRLSPLALRMAKVRRRAILEMAKPGHELCSGSPANTLIVPSGLEGGLAAYVLTSTRDAGIYPAGGHFRFDFDAAEQLLGERRFMKTCFSVDYRPKDGKPPEVLIVTHLLDPQPTELHAFVSRNIPVALAVATLPNSKLWVISKGRITFVRDLDKSE